MKFDTNKFSFNKRKNKIPTICFKSKKKLIIWNRKVSKTSMLEHASTWKYIKLSWNVSKDATNQRNASGNRT